MKTERVTIMDIPFDKVTLKQAMQIIMERLNGNEGKPFFVATPNPEMLLEARKNKNFKEILQQTDLNIPDGTGIIWAAKQIKNINGIKNHLPERVTGTDLMQALCGNTAHADHNTQSENAPHGHKPHSENHPSPRIFLLGGAPGVANKTQETLYQKHKTNIVGTCDFSADGARDKEIQEAINMAKPNLLFVAFGAPKQELWLKRNLPHLKTVKVAIGVGGAFDFISGARKRAPVWMQRMGIEWLFRLITQPARIKRIWRATIIFPIIFLFSEHSKK
jgi:N-acetylglucosaminyldiphosphoundecaprenol N-acetyl-beta-D-mannosaminyltransferase